MRKEALWLTAGLFFATGCGAVTSAEGGGLQSHLAPIDGNSLVIDATPDRRAPAVLTAVPTISPTHTPNPTPVRAQCHDVEEGDGLIAVRDILDSDGFEASKFARILPNGSSTEIAREDVPYYRQHIHVGDSICERGEIVAADR